MAGIMPKANMNSFSAFSSIMLKESKGHDNVKCLHVYLLVHAHQYCKKHLNHGDRPP